MPVLISFITSHCRHISFIILFGYLILLFLLAVLPVPDTGTLSVSYLDKAVHVLLYGVLTVLILCSPVFFFQPSGICSAGIRAIIAASFYGAALEVCQYFLPYRSFDLGDIVANMSGAFLFGIIAAYLRYLYRPSPV